MKPEDITKLKLELGLNETQFGILLGISRNCSMNWQKKDAFIPEIGKKLLKRIKEDMESGKKFCYSEIMEKYTKGRVRKEEFNYMNDKYFY